MTTRIDAPTGTLILSGRLTIDSAAALRLELMDALAEFQPLRLAGEAVEACDAAALQVLLAAGRSGNMTWTGPCPPVADLAAALGVPAEAVGAAAQS